MPKIFSLKTWLNEILSGSERYNIKENDGSSFKSNMQIELSTSVAQTGDSIDAENLNRIELGIDKLDTKLADALDVFVTQGISTAYTVTTIGGADLITWETFRVKFHVTSGSNPTLNRDGKGAKSLKYYDASGTKQNCTSAQITANLMITLIYDGVDYVLFGGGGGASDHGALTGLADDDHPQYLLANGLREWSEQASNPPNPAANKWKLFFKSLGLYLINSAGTVIGPLGREIKLSTNSPRVYTGNSTWTKPSNLAYIIVELVGGGAAGGGAPATGGSDFAAGSGGSAGGYSKKKILETALGATESVTVGAAGVGVSGSNGNNGGTSSFGAHLQATGGGGGVASAVSAILAFISVAAGGVGSGGDINSVGGAGSPGVRSTYPFGGNGGNSFFGGGAPGQVTAAAFNGNPGGAYGGGGSGAANAASQTARAGANGAPGVVIVWEYVYQ